MYRYIALIWNPADRERCATAAALVQQMSFALSSKWQPALEADGILVMHAGLGEGSGETRSLSGGAGVVLGKIFSSRLDSLETARRVSFDGIETEEIVATGGRRLFERYWGRYVAVVRDAATAEVWVLRDPLGQMPCLHTSYRGVNIVFSDLEDCLTLGTLRFTVDWNYLAATVANPYLLSKDTALKEVGEVMLGERLRFSGDSVTRSLEWHAFEVARSHPFQNVDDAVSQLRSTTRACVQAWASCYSNIVLNLSGGLDSSIVLSCLSSAASRPGITCLNYFGTGPSEDERQHARLMASHVKAELVESQLDPSAVRLERVLSMRRSARPWFYMYELEHGDFETRLADSKGARALFTGAGGDGIFFQARAELAVADYLFDHGVGRNLLRTARDAAQMSRKSIWPLLFKGMRARAFPKRWNAMAESGRSRRDIVNQDVLRAAMNEGSYEHPWFTTAATRGVPPGVQWHVACVAVPPAYYTSFGSEMTPERTLALLSQPLVELCLRMPSYLLIQSGRDRALARRAFAGDLPQHTVRRSAKGRIDHHLRNILDTNLKFVREFLLDGVLVDKGILNRQALDLYLTRERSPADLQYSEILQEHVCTEAWVRRSLEAPAASLERPAPATLATHSCAPAS